MALIENPATPPYKVVQSGMLLGLHGSARKGHWGVGWYGRILRR